MLYEKERQRERQRDREREEEREAIMKKKILQKDQLDYVAFHVEMNVT